MLSWHEETLPPSLGPNTPEDGDNAPPLDNHLEDLLDLSAYVEDTISGDPSCAHQPDRAPQVSADQSGRTFDTATSDDLFDFNTDLDWYVPPGDDPDMDPDSVLCAGDTDPFPPIGTEQEHEYPYVPEYICQASRPSHFKPMVCLYPSRRGLPRQRSRYLRNNTGQASGPVPIPVYPNGSQNSTLDPMQRWHDSPPEAEAASLADIAKALKDVGITSHESPSDGRKSQRRAYKTRQGPSSSTSAGTSVSSRSTISSRSTTSHHGPSRNSKRGGIAKLTGGGRKRTSESDNDKRRFPCTFCCDTFRTKYDWSRHEVSLHLSLERWVCTPHGGVVISQSTRRNHCAYCNVLDPSPQHLEMHNHSNCHASGEPPVFSRKDHLVQHLRLVHHVTTLPIIKDWKIEAPPMISRCGFCDLTMHTWRQRVDHLTQHFHEGKTMENWQGDHGFEPSIAAQVTNAIPPYALATESKSFSPFSATAPDSWDHVKQMKQFFDERNYGEEDHGDDVRDNEACASQIPESENAGDASRAGFSSMEWITLGLGRYARWQMSQGVIPTDEMFQNEARRLIYGSEDGWEQTIADNRQWLASFRSEHVNDTPQS